MKVAIATDTYWPRVNGVTVSTEIFWDELTLRGHEIRLWAPDYPHARDYDQAQTPDHRPRRLKSFPLRVSQEDRLALPSQRGVFFRQLDAFGPDLIHVQTEFVVAMMVRSYAWRRRLPVIQSCHTYFEQYGAFYFPTLPGRFVRAVARWLAHELTKHADAIVAPTQIMKDVLLSYGITIPITVVPTGIPAEEFRKLSKADEKASSLWYQRFPEWRGRPTLLFVGRVAQEKNVDFLLGVVETVRQKHPDVLLVVAGSGPHLHDFQAAVQRRGLAASVATTGYVDREELRHLYALADVFTFPSVTETQGLVTIEAMMCGTPAVAIGKLGTWVGWGGGDHGGYLVDEDQGAFTDAVLRLLGDPALWAAKSAEALAWSDQWTSERMADRLEALYQKVAADHRPRGGRLRRRPSTKPGRPDSPGGRGFP